MTEYIFDLLYHDGPLTSVFRTGEGADCYTIWDWQFQIDDKYHVWNTFNITRDILIKYLRKEISFTNLIKGSTNHKSNILDETATTISTVDIDVINCLPENEYMFDISMVGPHGMTIFDFMNNETVIIPSEICKWVNKE